MSPLTGPQISLLQSLPYKRALEEQQHHDRFIICEYCHVPNWMPEPPKPLVCEMCGAPLNVEPTWLDWVARWHL